MNPKNLNDERDLDAWLSRTLQNHSDYIDDAGFADELMSRLPARPARRFATLLWVVLAATVVGLLGLILIPAQAWAYALTVQLLSVSFATLVQGGLLATAALVISAAYWVWQED